MDAGSHGSIVPWTEVLHVPAIGASRPEWSTIDQLSFLNWKSMQIWRSIERVGKWKVGLDQPTSHWNGRMQWMSSMNEAILHPRRKRRRSRWAQLFEGQFSIFECLHQQVLFSARWTRVDCIRLVTMAAVTIGKWKLELGNGMWFLHWFTNSSSSNSNVQCAQTSLQLYSTLVNNQVTLASADSNSNAR